MYSYNSSYSPFFFYLCIYGTKNSGKLEKNGVGASLSKAHQDKGTPPETWGLVWLAIHTQLHRKLAHKCQRYCAAIFEGMALLQWFEFSLQMRSFKVGKGAVGGYVWACLLSGFRDLLKVAGKGLLYSLSPSALPEEP